jgi:hypothetical protein
MRGSGRPLGPDGELLVLTVPGQSTRVVRTQDGAQVEQEPSSRGAAARVNGSEPSTSPQGRFEILEDSKDHDYHRIIRRRDGALIARSQNYRFSADERWLAVWDNDNALTVYDLSRGEAIFRFSEKVSVASFAGQGILHVRFDTNSASMLIPLDWRLMDRLLRWLTSRELTPAQECSFGLRGKQCWNELPVQKLNGR